MSNGSLSFRRIFIIRQDQNGYVTRAERMHLFVNDVSEVGTLAQLTS